MSLSRRWMTLSAMLVAAVVGLAGPGRAGADEDEGAEAAEGEEGAEGEGADKAANSFEETRFFIDKADTDATADKTLVQGSFTSTNLFYAESGGQLGGLMGSSNASVHGRMFTDLRAQVDARHLGGGRWDARLDGRLRYVTDPGTNTAGGVDPMIDYGTRVQSGTFGRDEYDLRELWLVRGGKRSDIFIGRQFIPDLAAIKIDGIRIDYASSRKFTLLGFAGTHPMKTSRSVGFDYPVGRDGAGTRIGRIIPVAFGGGAAYRTQAAYGAVGGVAIVPLKAEQPRVFATANGYWRQSPKLDLYHFAVLDLFGSAGFQITNLSVGAQFKAGQRLRANAALSRVDTETLNTTAQTYLRDPGGAIVTNETEVLRIASDQARAGLSAALGKVQQIEASTSVALRRRPEIALVVSDMPAIPAQILPATQSADLQFGLVHRRLLRDLRVGLDVVRSVGVGGVAYAHSKYLSVRATASRELRSGRGQWDVELGYSTATDDNKGTACNPTTIAQCYGASSNSRLDALGTLYYRVRPNLFAIGSLGLGQLGLTSNRAGAAVTDPALYQFSGFLRLGYRY
ncbi:MAG: hypothetical protein KBG28_22975 [Kofleriaceae bacterium]|nr:hypothetical protein [Kofleriaceae bacterium]